MVLAGMYAYDRDALACDFAETYHVLDMWALPVPLLAVLASGLREDSRIIMKMGGITYIPAYISAAKAADELAMLMYSFTEDAQKGKNRPDLLSDHMVEQKETKKKYEGYDSGEDFLAAWKKITKGG